LSGREGFEFLSPSRRACEAGFSAFLEIKRLFSTAPEAKKWRRKEATGVIGRGPSTTDAFGQFNAAVRRAGARVCNRRVRTLAGPERSVTHPGEQREGMV
jgi:hypothetical protein